nr:MAG TPA: hypothetical protein [Caudoviricetes sp.]
MFTDPCLQGIERLFSCYVFSIELHFSDCQHQTK